MMHPRVQTSDLMSLVTSPYHYVTQLLVSREATLFSISTSLDLIIIFLDRKNISNEKVINCKILDLIEHYNFDIDLIFHLGSFEKL